MFALIFFSFIFTANHWESSAGWKKPAGCDFFTKQNAVRILGSDVTWTGTDSTAGEPKKWTCTFVQKNAANGPNVHFGLMKFADVAGAREDLDAIRCSNKSLAGFEELPGFGDEAIIHSDGANFALVVVRNGARTFRIKVNPLGSVQTESVKDAAKDLIEKMREMGDK